jgi:hypothetical protein
MSFLFMALWEQHSKLGARRTARRLWLKMLWGMKTGTLHVGPR